MMTDDEMRGAIAEKCGFSAISEDEHHCVDYDARSVTEWKSLDGTLNGKRERVPDYLTDLNAMHEAENVFEDDEIKWHHFAHVLQGLVEPHRHVLHATARQRAEAFCRTLWPERWAK